MKKSIIIDHGKKTLWLCRGFNIRAKNPETDEYEKLCQVRNVFPEYKVRVRTIKKKVNKESYKGLTYGYMEAYIDKNGSLDIMQEYKELRLLAECHSVRYPVIKAWFLEKFPEVKLYGVGKETVPDLKQSA